MSTPQELRQTAKQFRDTASLIYEREVREEYHTALDYLYEATRRELYASMIEGKEKEMERCIQISKPIHHEPLANERTHRDVRGRYKLFSQPYAQRKEESEIERHRHKERVKERQKKIEASEKNHQDDAEAVREGFKQMPLFSFGSSR